jgi:hypothetical protein
MRQPLGVSIGKFVKAFQSFEQNATQTMNPYIALRLRKAKHGAMIILKRIVFQIGENEHQLV